MNLATFTDKAGSTSINAADLDANFQKLRPLLQGGPGQRQYSVNTSPVGWSLDIFPPFPPSGALHVLGYKDGYLTWVPTQECQ